MHGGVGGHSDIPLYILVERLGGIENATSEEER